MNDRFAENLGSLALFGTTTCMHACSNSVQCSQTRTRRQPVRKRYEQREGGQAGGGAGLASLLAPASCLLSSGVSAIEQGLAPGTRNHRPTAGCFGGDLVSFQFALAIHA